ncbi:ATP-binding protein [Gemmatimonadota bacterium]
MIISNVMPDFIEFPRALKIAWSPNPRSGGAAVFLWGARQTGKSTYLHRMFPAASYYDLLDTVLSAELTVRPHRLREEVLAEAPDVVVVDEVQHVPALLTEVHWLLENTPTRFVLCGSSARRLRRESRNLLGGRAPEFHMLPLTSAEIGDADLPRILQWGGLPIHYLARDPAPLLRAYVNTYLKAEIIDVSATRNIPAFSRFLQIVGFSHGQQLNYASLARETGVSASTVRNYFQILEDTLLGFTLDPWRRRKKRKLVQTAKFYLFDIGVANYLHPEGSEVVEGSDRFGRAFEHFVLNEIRAYLIYSGSDRSIAFWRTSSGFEVDLIVDPMDVAIECKASKEVRSRDLRGLRALAEEHEPRRSIVVSRVERRRQTEDGIEVVPWQEFCRELWSGQLI